MIDLCLSCKWHNMKGKVETCAAGYLDAVVEIYDVRVIVEACHQYEQEEDNDE